MGKHKKIQKLLLSSNNSSFYLLKISDRHTVGTLHEYVHATVCVYIMSKYLQLVSADAFSKKKS